MWVSFLYVDSSWRDPGAECYGTFLIDDVTLGGKVQRVLGGCHGLIDLRRVVALFGDMVAPMAGMIAFMGIFTLKIAWRFDGGDGCSTHVHELLARSLLHRMSTPFSHCAC
jgi:hypothetical protein